MSHVSHTSILLSSPGCLKNTNILYRCIIYIITLHIFNRHGSGPVNGQPVLIALGAAILENFVTFLTSSTGELQGAAPNTTVGERSLKALVFNKISIKLAIPALFRVMLGCSIHTKLKYSVINGEYNLIPWICQFFCILRETLTIL